MSRNLLNRLVVASLRTNSPVAAARPLLLPFVLRQPVTLSQFRSFPPSPSRSLTTSTSTSTSQDHTTATAAAAASLTQRLRTLFRTHGWSALTIYLFLSLCDFSLTFLLIYTVGADKVRDAEDWVLDALGWRRRIDGEPGKMKRVVQGWKKTPSNGAAATAATGSTTATAPVPTTTTATANAVGEGEKGNNGYSTLATTAVLAYAIHKVALLPVRIGMTVAITPRVVRTLRAWGWNVGNAQVGAKVAVASTAGKDAAKKVVTAATKS